MKHLFYLIAIVYILVLFWRISNMGDYIKGKISFRMMQKENKGKSWGDMDDEYQDYLLKNSFLMIIPIWSFIGLLSFNWLLFLSYIIVSMLILKPALNLTKEGTMYVLLTWTKTIISVFLSFFVIINSYHLKIDLYSLLMDYLLH